MASFGSFAGGMAQGLGSGAGLAMRGVEMGMQARAAQRAQQLEQMKVAGDTIGKFADVMQNATDEQVRPLLDLYMSQMEKVRGQPYDPEAKKFIVAQGRNLPAILSNAYSQQGGFTMGQLSQALNDPQALIGAVNAMNKRSQYQAAARAFNQGMGGPEQPDLSGMQDQNSLAGLASTPLNQPLPNDSGVGSAGNTVSALPTPAQQTPAVGDLRGQQARINAIDQAIGAIGQNPDVPGMKERLGALQAVRDSMDKNIQFAIQNETTRAAGQLGINDITKASPQMQQLIQQQVFKNLGLGEQAKATGQAMGGLVNPETAAQTGLSPLSTVAEARGQGGAGGAGQAGPAGLPTLPNPQDIADLAAQRPFEIQRRTATLADATKAQSDNNTIASLRPLLPMIKTGVFGNANLQVGRLAKAFGLDVNGVAPTQVYQMLTDRLGIKISSELSGAKSNYEDQWLRGMMPSLSSDKQALPIFLDISEQLNNRSVQKNLLLSKFQSTCGLTGEKCAGKPTFDEYWDKWTQQHDLTPTFNKILDHYGYGGPRPDAQGNMPEGATSAPAPAAPAVPAGPTFKLMPPAARTAGNIRQGTAAGAEGPTPGTAAFVRRGY